MLPRDEPGIARRGAGYYADGNEKRSRNRWAAEITIQFKAANVIMSEQGKFLLYTAKEGAVKVEVFFRGETVWLTQKALVELFGVKVPAINKHLKNIFESGELSREATVSKMEIVRAEGEREVAREMEFYNLDAIIADRRTPGLGVTITLIPENAV